MQGPFAPLLGFRAPWPMGPSAQPNGPRVGGLPTPPQPGEPGGAVMVFDAHRYAWFRGDQVVAVNNAADTLVLPQSDPLRNMLLIRNSSATANLYISFGKQADLNSPLYLTPNQMVLFDTGVPQDDVHAYADAAAGQISIAFSTYN